MQLLLRLVLLLGCLAVAVQLISTQFLLPWVISGASMEPVLSEGDVVLVDLWTYHHREPRIGEVVLLQDAALPGMALVKRVSMFPGEAGWPVSTRDHVAGRSFWLLGDNAGASLDSRAFGAVPPERLRGRVVYRYWPPSRAGRIQPAQHSSPSEIGGGGPVATETN
jgi:signal peptidase I